MALTQPIVFLLFLARHFGYVSQQDQRLKPGETERAEELGRRLIRYCHRWNIPVPEWGILSPLQRADFSYEAIRRGMRGKAVRLSMSDPRFGDRTCGEAKIPNEIMARLEALGKARNPPIPPDRELVWNDEPEIRRVAQAFGAELATALEEQIVQQAQKSAGKTFSILGVGHSPRWEIGVTHMQRFEFENCRGMLLNPGEVLEVEGSVDLSVGGLVLIRDVRLLHDLPDYALHPAV